MNSILTSSISHKRSTGSLQWVAARSGRLLSFSAHGQSVQYLHSQSGDFDIRKDGPIGGLIPVAGFVSLDGRVAYNLTGRMTWSVSDQNLTYANQLQTSGPAVRRRVLGTMSINF